MDLVTHPFNLEYITYYRLPLLFEWFKICTLLLRITKQNTNTKNKNIWLLGNGLCFENKLQKETFYCFPLLGISKQQQEDIAVSPQYWARAAASKVVEQQASSKISNFPFWFSQNQKTNSILRKGFEIENSIAVISPLNGYNKGPYKRSTVCFLDRWPFDSGSFWFQHLWFNRTQTLRGTPDILLSFLIPS